MSATKISEADMPNDILADAMLGASAYPEAKSPTSAWDEFRANRHAVDPATLSGEHPMPVAYAARNAAAAPQPSALASGTSNQQQSAEPGNAFAAAGQRADAMSGLVRDTMPQPTNTRLRRPEDAEAALPPDAAEKLRKLREAKIEARAVANSIGNDRDEARLDLEKAKIRLTNVEKESQRYANPKARGDNDPDVIAERNRVAEVQAKFDRLAARHAGPAQRMQTIGRVLDRVERYVETARSIVPGPTLKPSAKDTLEAVTDRIRNFGADLEDVSTRPWPAEDVKRRMIAEVDFIASKGRVGVTQSLDFRGQLKWPTSERPIIVRGFGRIDERGLPDRYDESEISTATAIGVWVNRDAIVDKLTAEIDELADDARAMSENQRKGEITKIVADILTAQRIIAEIIWRDGLHDQWPADLDPRAVLGIEGPAPKD
jgi:hypothetical protein